jgi:hypothetical protein
VNDNRPDLAPVHAVAEASCDTNVAESHTAAPSAGHDTLLLLIIAGTRHNEERPDTDTPDGIEDKLIESVTTVPADNKPASDALVETVGTCTGTGSDRVRVNGW